MFAAFATGLIRLYQATLSPDHGVPKRLGLSPGRCRFYPSCSEYARQCIQKRGLLVGLLRSARRVLRCHPFAEGGIDDP